MICKVRKIKISKFQLGILINTLNSERKRQIASAQSTEQIDTLLLRLIDIYDDM